MCCSEQGWNPRLSSVRLLIVAELAQSAFTPYVNETTLPTCGLFVLEPKLHATFCHSERTSRPLQISFPVKHCLWNNTQAYPSPNMKK